MVHKHRKLTPAEIFIKFISITVGAALAGIALEFFLVNNTIIDGGITGISIVLTKVTDWPLGVFLFLINLPFLFIGYKQVGKTFAISSLYGIIILALTTTIFHHYAPVTEEKILAVLFGGLLLGFGVGLVLRTGGSTDGAEILAILISKKTEIPVGQIILGINVLIFTAAGFMLGWDSAMYSIFTFYIATKVMDIVVEGLNESKSVTIISKEYEEISQAIMDRLGRSTTYIYARGGYSQEETQMIYCVVTRLEVAKLKAVVQDIDRKAFIAIEHVSDVSGGSFAKKSIH